MPLSRIRRLAGALTLALLLTTPSPSPAATRPDRDRVTAPSWVRGPSSPALVDLAKESRSGALTLGRLLELRGRILASEPLQGGGRFISPSTLEVPKDEEYQAYLVPFPAGDLDGDGREDVLAIEADYFYYGSPLAAGAPPRVAGQAPAHEAGEGGLRAISGADGSTLWRLDLGYDDAFQVGDADGDGQTDVLLSRLTVIGGPVITLDQRVELLNGATGQPSWSASIPGIVAAAGAYGEVYVGSDAVYYDAIVLTVRDLVATVQLMPDADGDGVPDVFAGSIDLATAGAWAGYGGGASVSRFVARALDGASGEVVGEAVATSLGPIGSLPWGGPAPDLSGDGRADAIVIEEGARTQLRALGFDGTEHWVAPVDAGIPSAPGDLTGDGTADVVVLEVYDYWFGYSETVGISVYDGPTGTRRWHTDTYDTPFVYLVGPADGVGLDFVLAGWAYNDETGIERLVLRARNGADGSLLWSRPVVAPSVDAYVLFCTCPSDLTGDGVDDLLAATVEYTEDAEALKVRAISGSTGDRLWLANLTSWDQLPLPLEGDADGDGAGDLFWTEWSWDEDTGEETLTIPIVRGINRAPLWTAVETRAAYIYWTNAFGADVTGSGGDELVLGLEVYDFDAEDYTTPITAHGSAGRIWST